MGSSELYPEHLVAVSDCKELYEAFGKGGRKIVSSAHFAGLRGDLIKDARRRDPVNAHTQCALIGRQLSSEQLESDVGD